MSKFSLKNITLAQILSVIGIIFSLIFIYQNSNKVIINVIIWQFWIPLFILLVVTFILGFFTAVAFGKDKIREWNEVIITPEITKNVDNTIV